MSACCVLADRTPSIGAACLPCFLCDPRSALRRRHPRRLKQPARRVASSRGPGRTLSRVPPRLSGRSRARPLTGQPETRRQRCPRSRIPLLLSCSQQSVGALVLGPCRSAATPATAAVLRRCAGHRAHPSRSALAAPSRRSALAALSPRPALATSSRYSDPATPSRFARTTSPRHSALAAPLRQKRVGLDFPACNCEAARVGASPAATAAASPAATAAAATASARAPRTAPPLAPSQIPGAQVPRCSSGRRRARGSAALRSAAGPAARTPAPRAPQPAPARPPHLNKLKLFRVFCRK